MKFPIGNSGRQRSLLASLVSLILAILPFFPTVASPKASPPIIATQGRDETVDATISSASAIGSEQGVLLQWNSRFEKENLGFNVYRLRDGRRTRVNGEIIPGSVFTAGEQFPLRGSYSWLDRNGTPDSTYYVESVSLDGKTRVHEAIRPLWKGRLSSSSQLLMNKPASSGALASETESSEDATVREYAAAQQQLLQTQQPTSLNGLVEDQWAIAAQPGLKIYIKKDGWYKVTQSQMAAAGFNPTVDVSNLLLYGDGLELAIKTSKRNGPLNSGDYFEFYGRGLDRPDTDTRTYYLIAGTRPGKRILGEVQTTVAPAPEAGAPSILPLHDSFAITPRIWFGFLFRFRNGLEGSTEALIDRTPRVTTSLRLETPLTPAPEVTRSHRLETPLTLEPEVTNPAQAESPANPLANLAPEIVPLKGERKSQEQNQSAGPAAKRKRKKGSKQKKYRNRKVTAEHHHAAADTASAATAAPAFDYTVERKERLVYFSSLLNGDVENFFGQVISSNPVTETVTSLNPGFTADGPAKLEVALQGVDFVSHEVNIQFNDVPVGTLNFFGRDRRVQTISIPLVQLRNGDNTLKFTPTSGSGVSIIDYVRLTYPHSYRADNNSLRFSLRSTQSAKIEGFSTPNVRLIDHTDPFSVRVMRPVVEDSGGTYVISVPARAARSKSRRLLYAAPETQAEQPAGFALNQPSTLNLDSNGADFVVVTHKSFLQSVAPLADLRRSQGFTVSVVDVEDIYDEFDFGAHGPKAVREFLARAASRWTKSPRYAMFLGDASLDPRNYLGAGDFDFVPTKLVDATYSEACSDDWLTDLNNDGIADISVGRLPVRTVAEADLAISKIVNFAVANVPQSALLVADAQGSYYYNFEQANDEVQSLLPTSMTVNRVNRRTEASDAVARANITSKLNQGQSLVNYTGHGNVNTWTGGAIFTSTDAKLLTNGNKLSFVVVMDCLNGYFHDPNLEGIAEALIKAPNGGAVAAFASSGLTVPDGQHAMSRQMYLLLYGSQSIPLGDIVKTAKAATTDIDVRRTWIFFGDPSLRIR